MKKPGPKKIYKTKIKNVYVGLPDDVRTWYETRKDETGVPVGRLLRLAAIEYKQRVEAAVPE